MFRKALAGAGVEVHTPVTISPGEPGILVFDEVSDALLDLVRVVSRTGVERVLLLAAEPESLDRVNPWRLLRAGASDVLPWDVAHETCAQVAVRLERWATVDELVASPLVRDHLVGETSTWVTLMRRAVEVARFGNASMLITGETGTGKELLARLVHTLDARADKQDLVVLDCTTVVPTLSGSEFFGHERGAFTGAVAPRDGAFAVAHRGTLFLDEVGELSLGLQSELLRVIQEGTYKRVGSDTWRQTNFRLICATNRDLLAAQEAGTFRRDLYFRLAAWSCRMPPLRERRADIPILARHFLAEVSRAGEELELEGAVMRLLEDREYPGNVRDLRQLIARIAGRHVGSGRITAGDVPPEDRPESASAPGEWPGEELEPAIRHAIDMGITLREIGTVASDAAVRMALVSEGGSIRRAASRLGVTQRALQLRQARSRDRARADPRKSITALPGSSVGSFELADDVEEVHSGSDSPSPGSGHAT